MVVHLVSWCCAKASPVLCLIDTSKQIKLPTSLYFASGDGLEAAMLPQELLELMKAGYCSTCTQRCMTGVDNPTQIYEGQKTSVQSFTAIRRSKHYQSVDLLKQDVHKLFGRHSYNSHNPAGSVRPLQRSLL